MLSAQSSIIRIELIGDKVIVKWMKRRKFWITVAILLLVIVLVVYKGTVVCYVPIASEYHSSKATNHSFETEGTGFIQLEGAACFGTCPVYRLILQSNGDVTFIGDLYTKVNGPVRDSIGRLIYEKIKYNIEKSIIYDSVVDSRIKGSCPDMFTDNPTTSLVYKSIGTIKSYIHYHGCRGNPIFDSLGKIEEEILAAVGAKQKWFLDSNDRSYKNKNMNSN
jgi:hypothetical protein